MDVDVVVEADIRRPRREVWAFASDPLHAPRWYRNIRTVAPVTTGPLAVGSRYRFVARFLGRTLEYTYEVLELVPERRLVMSTAQGPFPMTTTYVFADLPTGSTRMTLRNHGSPGRLVGVATPVVRSAMRRAVIADLARLTRLLERR